MTATPDVISFRKLLFPRELRTIAESFEIQSNLSISNSDITLEVEPRLGRLKVENLHLPQSTIKRITKKVNTTYGTNLEMVSPPLFVEYNLKYGEPNLPPHFDGDFNDLIIDYQLASNTSWNLGIDAASYPLEDNYGLAFNPNTHAHWRPRKTFKEGEYVRMAFFRFFDPRFPSDYSHLPNHPDDEVFNLANKFRDSLTS